MKTTALLLALASVGLFGSGAAIAASGNTLNTGAATETHQSQASEAIDTSARKKVRRHRHVHRGYGASYGYYQPYGQGYYRQGYYRGVRPGWGYGPDPGDNAWPPFHFKPYW